MTTRRALIQKSAAALAVGAVAIPAAVLATTPDPIFAVIEAHKRVAIIGLDDDDEAWAEDYDEACIVLFTTRPTTVAGVASVLEYVNQYEHGDEENYSILANTSFENRDGELKDASLGFLPMIAETLRGLRT